MKNPRIIDFRSQLYFIYSFAQYNLLKIDRYNNNNITVDIQLSLHY